MAQVGSTVTSKLQAILSANSGVSSAISLLADQEGLRMPPFGASQVIAQNVSPELIERSTANRYPTIHVYCGKVMNTLREKFRTFSGDAQMVVEIRVSQDRLEGLEAAAQFYVDAVTQVLDDNRGDWGDGVFYGGGYEVTYGPVKHGGRNFLQSAKIVFVLGVSRN